MVELPRCICTLCLWRSGLTPPTSPCFPPAVCPVRMAAGGSCQAAVSSLVASMHCCLPAPQPYAMLMPPCLPSTHRRGTKGGPPARASAWEIFLLSSLAKLGATLVTYPMMNIKTRM